MRNIVVIGLLFSALQSAAQCYPLALQAQFSAPLPFPRQSMTALHDLRGLDYLYVAGTSDGVRIYDISDTANVFETATVPTPAMDSLDAMSLWQSGDRLFVALGNFFSDDQHSGLAVIDVSNPASPNVLDTWKHDQASGGAGIVRTDGNYAYLAAMQHGLFVLDISDPANVQEVSQFVPDISFPNPANPDPAKYNARGMQLDGDAVYLCYDAGGMRVINVADKSAPRETGRYSLPALDNLPRAYNNAILDTPYLYVSIDYCGMEVLDISDTSNITQVAWWNPWDCTTSPLAWFNSPGHTNEMAYLEHCNLLGMSSGKSEAVFVDVSDPSQPLLCDSFGSVHSDRGTWGISLYEGAFYLAYIHVPLGIPFHSNWAGIEAVKVNHSCAVGVQEKGKGPASVTVFYDYERDAVILQSTDPLSAGARLRIHDLSGRLCRSYVLPAGGGRQLQVPAGMLPTGVYIAEFRDQGQSTFRKVFIE